MKTNHRRPDSYGVVMTLVILLSVWLVNSNGLLQKSDDHLSDLMNAFSARSYTRSDLLLVYAPKTLLESNDGELVNLVRSISEFNPAKIGIAHALPPQQQKSLSSLSFASDIIVGCKRSELVHQQANGTSGPLNIGFLDLHLDGQAIYRKHIVKDASQAFPLNSFEAVIADQFTLASTPRSENAFRELLPGVPYGPIHVRFYGGVSGKPNIGYQEIVDGNVIEEMFQDRIVLIGAQPNNEIGFVTPTTTGSERMSALELHANVLESILRQSHIVGLSSLSVLAIFGLVALVCVQGFRNISKRWLVRTWLICLLAITVMCAVVISVWSVQLPLTAMLLSACLAFVFVLYSRFCALKDLVDNWKILHHTSDRIVVRTQEENCWEALAESVDQIFHPRRMVLMELATGATHLSVMHLHGCESGDIQEMRRDIHRVPYRDAIEQNYPTPTEQRRFFVESNDSEFREYVVPLIMVSEVIGFMVLEMDEATIKQWGDFEQCLSNYSREMAIFLAGTRSQSKARMRAQQVVHRTKVLPERSMAGELYTSEIQHRSFETMLGNALDSAETAIAVCDVFGRVVKTNAKMIIQLQRDDVSIHDLACVEILCKLTDRDANECRKIFRRCIIEDRSETIILPSKVAHESSSVMTIKPLRQSGVEKGLGIESRFVAIEIVSGDIFSAINHWQQKFLESQSQRLDEQMQVLLKIAGEIEMARRDGDDSTDPYLAAAREVLDSVTESQAATGAYLTDSQWDIFPVDTPPVLAMAIRHSEALLENQGIVVHKALCDDAPDVTANPFLLEQAFATIIECLASEVEEETELLIESEQADEQLHYRFSTKPIHSAPTPFELSVTIGELDPTSLTSEDALLAGKHLDRLQEANRWLEKWDASLTINCDATYRVSILLSLSTPPVQTPAFPRIDPKTTPTTPSRSLTE